MSNFEDEWDRTTRYLTEVWDGMTMPKHTPERDQSDAYYEKARNRTHFETILGMVTTSNPER